MQPSLLESRRQPVREAVVLTVASVFPSFMAWAYFVALTPPAGDAPLPEPSPALRVAYFAGKFAQFAFPLVYLALADPGTLRPRPPRLEGWLLGLAFGVAIGGAMLLAYFGGLRGPLVAMGLQTQVRGKLEAFGATSTGTFLAFAAFLCLAHSLMEEYYWRWFVFRRVRLLWPLAPALVVSSLAFMAHHVVVLSVYLPNHFLSAVVPLSLGVAVGGAFWAWLYQRTGSLVAAWWSHALIDAAIMVIGYDLVFTHA